MFRVDKMLAYKNICKGPVQSLRGAGGEKKKRWGMGGAYITVLKLVKLSTLVQRNGEYVCVVRQVTADLNLKQFWSLLRMH